MTFGSKKGADISLDKISFLNNNSFASLVLDNKIFSDFSVGALGYHQLLNCLSAVGVILNYDLDLKIALRELKKWKPRNGRGRFLDISFKKNLKKIKIRIIDESYNCNPSSLNASLEILKYVKFGTTTKKEKNEKDEEVEVVEDNIINNPRPAWTIAPKKLKDQLKRIIEQ